MADPTTIIPLVAAFAGALLAYLGTVRKLSGKVKTSDASQSWEEARLMREDYRSRIAELNVVISGREKRMGELEKRNDELYVENGRPARMLEDHEAPIAELRGQQHRLSEENEPLKTENVSLQARVAELEEAC